MLQSSPTHRSVVAAACVTAMLAACAGPRVVPVRESGETPCAVAAQGEPLIGNWMSVRREKGVAGELRTLISLRADGTMSYQEQLSRPGRAPQGLSETGCWERQGSAVVLRTLASNGSPVDPEDPIYVNRYQLTRESAERIGLQGSDGVRVDARRMPSDYRLPL